MVDGCIVLIGLTVNREPRNLEPRKREPRNLEPEYLLTKGSNMAVITEKREALDYFLKRLLDSEVKDYIAKILLFGSVASGDATAGSDIDVFVFTLGETEKVRMACADASFEAVLEYGESVEPMVYPANEFRYPTSDFVSSAVQRGKEVYSMKEEEISRGDTEDPWRDC